MKRTSSSIKLKAIFLLVVFLLNTVVTFACSIGLEMRFNDNHHEDETSIKRHDHGGSHKKAKEVFQPEPKRSHNHAGGSAKPHEHSEKSSGALTPEQPTTYTHERVGTTNDHHKAGSPDDNCCKDEAIKFGKADKILQKSAGLKIAPAFLPLVVIPNNNVSAESLPAGFVSRKHFVRGHHPPIANIRIAIQSFQV